MCRLAHTHTHTHTRTRTKAFRMLEALTLGVPMETLGPAARLMTGATIPILVPTMATTLGVATTKTKTTGVDRTAKTSTTGKVRQLLEEPVTATGRRVTMTHAIHNRLGIIKDTADLLLRVPLRIRSLAIATSR